MELSPMSEIILDYMLNVGPIFSCDGLVSHVMMLTTAETEEVWSEWNRLHSEGIIAVRENEHVVAKKCLGEVESRLQESLSARGVNADMIGSQLDRELSDHPERLNKYVKLIGSLTEAKDGGWHVSFSDYEWSYDPGPTCDEFVRMRIMFLEAYSSRKHSYRFYSLRRWPFDSHEMLNHIVLKHLRIDGLSDTDWRLLFHLLLSKETTLPYEILKSIQDITESELRESVNSLKDKGQLTEKYNSISVVKGACAPLSEYFCMNVYPRFKSEIVSRIRKRIMEGLSNLHPFMYARRMCELPTGDTKGEPISLKAMKKSDIGEPGQISDMVRLGLAMDLGDNLVILVDVVKEVENWVRGCLKSSLILIPAGDAYLARSVLIDMFSRCESYVKIQDPYLGEETFHILSRYVPEELELKVLTGQTVGRGEDIEYICRNIERLKNERGGKFQIIFMQDKEGEVPFHDRYIISQNTCWSVGTSLKQIGRGKDTTIVEVSPMEKAEKIEPAFDWNWHAKKIELEKKGLTRLDFSQWKDSILL